jgi:hypothetical protein
MTLAEKYWSAIWLGTWSLLDAHYPQAADAVTLKLKRNGLRVAYSKTVETGTSLLGATVRLVPALIHDPNDQDLKHAQAFAADKLAPRLRGKIKNPGYTNREVLWAYIAATPTVATGGATRHQCAVARVADLFHLGTNTVTTMVKRGRKESSPDALGRFLAGAAVLREICHDLYGVQWED